MAELSHLVRVGKNLGSSQNVSFDAFGYREHSLTIGASRAGKSYYELLRINALLNTAQAGGMIIDPHSELAEDALKLITSTNLHNAKRIIYFNPANPKYCVGWNPITSVHTLDDYFRAAVVLDSILHGFKQYDTVDTPRISRWLLNVLLTLVKTGRKIKDSRYLLYPTKESEKFNQILEELRVKDDDICRTLVQEWEWIKRMGQRGQTDMLEGSINRVRPFLLNTAIANIFNVDPENSINFKDIVEGRQILIVNLHGLPTELQKIMGSLLISNMYMYAKTRRKSIAKKNPFYVWVDEFGSFATRTAALALDQTGKMGVWWQLAIQGTYQLREKDSDYLLRSAFQNAGIKSVFQLNDTEESDVIQRMVFAGQFDGLRVKDEIYKLNHRNHQKWVDVISTTSGNSEMKGGNQTHAIGGSHSDMNQEGDTEGKTEAIGKAGIRGKTKLKSHTDMSSKGGSSNNGGASGSSNNQGKGTRYNADSYFHTPDGHVINISNSAYENASWSEGNHHSEGIADTEADGTMESIADTKSDAHHKSKMRSKSTTDTKTWMDSKGITYADTVQYSETKTPQFISEVEPFEELSSRTYFGLNEIDRINSDKLTNLPRYHCYIKKNGQLSVFLKVKTMPSITWSPKFAELVRKEHKKRPYFFVNSKEVVNEALPLDSIHNGVCPETPFL